MNNKTFLSSSHQPTGRVQLVTDNYHVNQMFAFCVIGIVAFLGLAWTVGKAEMAPMTKQSSTSLSAQIQR
ncbi:hypothetical protein [Altericista sp. CCNU0014]|uniref:hypothetical protein n=1 Tax=Altericista sp. CCNU0014 TaxID=3082949 RepID=UPI0038516AD9